LPSFPPFITVAYHWSNLTLVSTIFSSLIKTV
jgi:hypothetical protein